jgi:hypothetical protein
LADNLQAYPFVCSCHHCHCVFGPPPETISLSKMLPREHTTKRTYPRKNGDCQLQKRRSHPQYSILMNISDLTKCSKNQSA